MDYEILDIFGDVGLRVWGDDLSEAFKNAASGMYSLVTDTEKVESVKTIEISIEGHSIEGLLIKWLNELIFYMDTYGFIGKKIHILSIEGLSLKASVSGEDFDSDRHHSGLLIKAATYHDLKIEKTDDKWIMEIVFDI